MTDALYHHKVMIQLKYKLDFFYICKLIACQK